MRNSRWSIEGHKDEKGRLIPVLFNARDLEICKLLARVRKPWGYQYLPTNYFHLLLNRGVKVCKRLDELTDKPNCYIKKPEQPRNNYRPIIYALADKGADELRAAGMDVPRQHLREIPHELMACLIAASFEYGARIHNTPIFPREWPDNDTRPDWAPFLLGDTLVILEADMGSETIYTEQDATAISEKLLHYLALTKNGSITKHFKIKKFIILFITTRESRRDSMVEVLKKVIDKHYYDDDDFAEHFGFTNIEYDRYINKIPKLTDWALSQPYQRAGFDPLTLIQRS